MRTAIVAVVFIAGFAAGQISQAQPKPSPPAGRVTGIGGIFIKARDPKALAA